jgi:membrane protease YdiL (CAAX protease family)
MVQTLVLALLLALIFSFFLERVQSRLRSALHNRFALIWLAPLLLSALFGAAAFLAGAFTLRLALLVLAYTAAPVLCAYSQGAGMVARPTALDFACILLLWLPLEFAALPARLVERPAQAFLHSVIYGIAIVLGLTLFLCFRSFPGLKYNAPRGFSDLWVPAAGYAILAPVLMVLGILLGFIPPPHAPGLSTGKMAAEMGIIFVGTALPEEILFRSMIQNLMMQRFGETTRVLLAASVIFGCAHLDNGPQSLPNWRYAILATIAGIAYGKVFQKASTVTSSALLHMLIDATKHFFF